MYLYHKEPKCEAVRERGALKMCRGAGESLREVEVWTGHRKPACLAWDRSLPGQAGRSRVTQPSTPTRDSMLKRPRPRPHRGHCRHTNVA